MDAATGTSQIDLNRVWNAVTDEIKRRVTMPALWRAMEAAHPLVLDEDVLVLGYSALESYQSALLMDSRHRNVIEQVLTQGFRRRVTIRTIAGDSLTDWEMIKATEAETARQLQQQKTARPVEAGSANTWDQVGEDLIRRLTGLPNRGLVAVQAEYLEQAYPLLVDAYRRLMPAQPAETDLRAYSRVLERLGERLGLPGLTLAWEVRQRVSVLDKGETR